VEVESGKCKVESSISIPNTQLSKNMAQPDQVARNIRQIGPVGRAMLKILLDGGSLSVERMGQALARAGVALRPPDDATMGETETKSNPDYIGIPSLKDAVTRCAMCGVIFAADPPSAAELANALGTRLIVPDVFAPHVDVFGFGGHDPQLDSGKRTSRRFFQPADD
jgi:hypothetical protein